ncbi:hypothetical protein MycrhDRAFT_6502 [Mycolicibacterium rhodesiae JS60]|nr:hypothetical protein MycrhDRAFT_6502 [Mycolicibacterium rhodesiae JS60]
MNGDADDRKAYTVANLTSVRAGAAYARRYSEHPVGFPTVAPAYGRQIPRD